MFRRGIVLTIVLLLCALSPARAGSPLRIRVLTFNIHHGEGTDGRLDLPRIAEVIKAQTPNLAALEEVDKRTTRSKGVDQAAELGRLTGMHAAFGRAMDFAGGEYGLAILSRTKPLAMTTHPLPAAKGCEPRAALAARIKLDGGCELLFAATHLEHANAEVRLTQAREVNKLFVKDDPLPAVLAGDLNDTPESATIKTLLEKWTDTAGPAPQPTWPSDKPRMKIDYVLVRPAGAWRVVEQRVIEESRASDHRPLLAVLERSGEEDTRK